MNEIIQPNNPNPIHLNKIQVKKGSQVDLNLDINGVNVKVKLRVAYFGKLKCFKEDVGQLGVGFQLEEVQPPLGRIVTL